MIKLLNMDCMDLMAEYDDNHFDLAIVDPPYGIGANKMVLGTGERNFKRRGNWDDSIPSPKYFKNLFRISKNQIIWGANHFVNYLPISRGWVFWDKMTDGFAKSYSSGELAFSSFDKPLKQITYKQQGNYIGFEKSITTLTANPQDKKIHPTQKPVKLYEWLLMNYAKEGDKILDTHLGSGSIAIACHNYEYDLVGCEIDKEYYDAMMKRYNNHIAQQNLFTDNSPSKVQS